MADIDPELLERTIRWCADAGRQTTPAHAEAALRALSWDELLTVRALLADPPPARPLGPFALADISRGAPADVAAERERAGRYSSAIDDATPAASPPRPSSARRRQRARAPFVVRRASERAPPSEPARPSPPLLDELLLEEGRAVLTRLVRRHGGRRARITEALAAGWRRADGLPVTPPDLDGLLAHHGMARAFEIRERDEVLHALRAAGGVRATAAAQLGVDLAALDEAIERLGARADSERIREQRRRELRARGTLTERVHLVLDDGARLSDLGLVDEFLKDLRARLPDHVRALSASPRERLDDGLCRSLSLDERGIERLAQVTGIRLVSPQARASGSPRPTRRPPEDRPRAGKAGQAPSRGLLPSPPRRTEAARPSAARTGPGDRKGRPPGDRPRGGPRPGSGGRRPPKRG